MKRTAIYPGSFDPVTYGHMDIVGRGRILFDHVIVVILNNPGKKTLFTVPERLEMLKESMKDLTGVSFDTFDGLLVDYARDRGVRAILRGMRAVSDFEHEFQLALMNRKLNRNIETVFLMTGMRWFFTSSSIIKEAAMFEGDISDMVPPNVYQRVKARFKEMKKA
ncbi:MAG: pantetheine-phosphate adenylyltransferase [Desulfatitalea sp.]|nr:pantetheine-phosphate adenylyltransferase [Desulfatitalea sp.]NNK00251.1 pantetheine-phosphate adenylyltransferase [Desulfatitalea sp.]